MKSRIFLGAVAMALSMFVITIGSHAADPQQDPNASTEEIDPASLTEDQLVAFVRKYRVDPEVSNTIDTQVGQMFIYGETVQGWQYGGVDILARLDALEGGQSSNLLSEVGGGMRAVNDLSGSLPPIPPGYRRYTFSHSDGSRNDEQYLLELEDGIWAEIGQSRTQYGNALCYAGEVSFSVLSARPFSEWSRDLLQALAGVYTAIDRLSEFDLCLVYDLGEDGLYTVKAHNRQGTALPAVSARLSPSRVISAESLQDLMAQ